MKDLDGVQKGERSPGNVFTKGGEKGTLRVTHRRSRDEFTAEESVRKVWKERFSPRVVTE